MKEYAEKTTIFLIPPTVDIKIPSTEWYLDYSAVFVSFRFGTSVCTKIYRFVEYTPMKCFNKFVQSAVNARREVMKTQILLLWSMKVLANRSYGYQIMDRSRHTVTII